MIRVVPEHVLNSLFRTYCLAKFNYPMDAYIDGEARNDHIESDARRYWENDEFDPALLAVVTAAWIAGYETGKLKALDVEEWQVVHRLPGLANDSRSCWTKCASEDEARRDLAAARVEAMFGELSIEHRRVGATDWKRVD